MRAADEAAGEDAGWLAIAIGDLPVDDGGDIALRMLHQAPAAARKIARNEGAAKAHIEVVDEVDIGAIAGGEDTAIVQPDNAGGAPGHGFHDKWEGQARPTFAVADPMGEHESGIACVADRAHMRAAVAETNDAALMA